jgi:hypothetical protein
MEMKHNHLVRTKSTRTTNLISLAQYYEGDSERTKQEDKKFTFSLSSRIFSFRVFLLQNP